MIQDTVNIESNTGKKTFFSGSERFIQQNIVKEYMQHICPCINITGMEKAYVSIWQMSETVIAS